MASKPKTLKHPAQPTYIADGGIQRFKPNAMVQFILLNTPRFDLNKLAELPFSDEDRQQLMQLLGYSVSGYRELDFTASDKRKYRLVK